MAWEIQGISSPIFMSPNRFGVLEVEEESSDSLLPSKGEEAIFLYHIRKLLDAVEAVEMRLTRSKSKLSMSNEGSLN